MSVPVPTCVCTYCEKSTGLETDETNRCQICQVGPFSGRWAAVWSPISHLAVLIGGHAVGSLMYAARPEEC